MAELEGQFHPRPWPPRPTGDSVVAGRRTLVLDGDRERGRGLAAALSVAGSSAQSTGDWNGVEALLATTEWEVVLADGKFVGLPELELLQRSPARPEVLVLGHADGGLGAVEALAAGAGSFVQRPVALDQIQVRIGRLLEQRTLAQENRRLKERLAGREHLAGFVSHDPAMQRVLHTAQAVADTRATVLLLGESGTGKTKLARAIHEHTARSGGPFIVVNCGALPSSLLESELFGHVKGAFTGAIKDRPGKFEQADGGTIFLDEVNSASLDLQVKLLRVLQERAFERVGDSRTREVDVRVLAASNRDLEEEIEAGRFREDLYWRLKVVSLSLPPLRERPADVARLAQHFLEHFAEVYDKELAGLTPTCTARLVAHDWPGNVRQLENVLERAVLLASGPEVRVQDLGEEFGGEEPAPAPTDGASLLAGLRNLTSLPPLKEALEGPERAIILRALEINSGNRQRTAHMLDVNRSTLHNKMRKYGLMELRFDPR